jgi:hypothetical protein
MAAEGVVLLLFDFGAPSQNSMAVVLKLETQRMNARMKLSFMG